MSNAIKGAALLAALMGAAAMAAPSAASAAPIPTTSTPTIACTGLTPVHQIGGEGDSSQGITFTYGDEHTWTGFGGPGGAYSLWHQQYIANNGTGRTILNARGVLADFRVFRGVPALVDGSPGHPVNGANGISMYWDNATHQYRADATETGFDGSEGGDPTYPGYSVIPLQTGSASPMTYESAASLGNVQLDGEIDFSGNGVRRPTDLIPTYALGPITPGATADSDFMVAVEEAPGSGTGWGTDLHLAGQFQCPVLSGTLPTTGSTGTAFSGSLSATAEGAVVYSIGNGALPSGLTLDPATGAVTGTPTTAGSSTFAVFATDAWGEYDRQTYTIAVTAAAGPSTSSSPAPADPPADPPVVPAVDTAVAPGQLAFTGPSVEVPLITGLSLLAAGGVALSFGRPKYARRH